MKKYPCYGKLVTWVFFSKWSLDTSTIHKGYSLLGFKRATLPSPP